MVRSFLRPDIDGLRTEFLRPNCRLSDSFSSLWAVFTLTVHINTLYNERVGLHGKEEHAT